MYLENLVTDAVDPQRLGRFWEAVVGGEQLTDEHAGYETRLTVEGGPVLDLCFQRVSDPSTEPPRLHLDLAGGARQAEVVDRLLGLGARPLDIGQGDVPWVVLADPEGNPFCVLEERAAYADSGPVAAFVLDSADPDRDAEFWSWLTGWTHVAGVAPRSLRHPSGRGPLLELVPERSPKGAAKNRLHLDVRLETGDDDADGVEASIVQRGGARFHTGVGRAAVALLHGPVGQRVLRAAGAGVRETVKGRSATRGRPSTTGWGMDRVARGEGTLSLEDAYREHRVALLRLAYLVGASRELAEDVVQAAFASAQPRWDQVEDGFAYLKRAVVNQVKDDQRRWYRRLRHGAVHDTAALSVLPPEVDETWGVIVRAALAAAGRRRPALLRGPASQRDRRDPRQARLHRPLRPPAGARTTPEGTAMTTTRDPIEDQIRHTLHAVAQTVTEGADPQATPASAPDRTRAPAVGQLVADRRRRGHPGAAGGRCLRPVGSGVRRPDPGGHDHRQGSRRRGPVPPRGEPPRRTYRGCGEPVPGVELVEEDENLLGSEWNTVLEQYGEAGGNCAPDTREYLANPALYNDGGTTVGDSFVWLWAVHPDVTAVRVTMDGSSEELPVYSVDGAGYALLEIPSDVDEYTAELLIGDQVVPGSIEEQRVPQR